MERTSEALWSLATARYRGDPGRHARGDGARRGGRQAPYTCHHPRRTAQGRLHDRPRASGWAGKIIGYDKGRDAIARKSNAIGNCLSSEQGEPGAAPRGDISPTPEVEPLNIPLEPSPFEREKVERQAAADQQRRQEYQRLMEQIEAVKAHGRHHARRLSVGNPSGSFHSGPRYATRDGLPIVRPGWRDFE